MGKLTKMILIIVGIDLLFQILGLNSLTGSSSLIVAALNDPLNLRNSGFYLLFLGASGIAQYVAQSGVTTGFLAFATNVLAFTSMAIGISGILGDFLTVYTNLYALNPVVATIIMTPIMILFVMVIVEWLRGKD